MAQQQPGQRNSHFAIPAFDASEIPACGGLASDVCKKTEGCEYMDATSDLPEGCVPRPLAFFNTISHPNQQNDTKVTEALNTLTGGIPTPGLTGLMQSDRHWLMSDMASNLRPPGIGEHPWTPKAHDTWDREKVVGYARNDARDVYCGICHNPPDGTPCEHMKCCGKVFHIGCSNYWFSDPSHLNCPGCNTIVRAPGVQNNPAPTRYNMTHHIPSDTIRSSSRDGCMRLTSPVAGDNSLCSIDFEFAINVAKIGRYRTRYGDNPEMHFDTYISELVEYMDSRELLGGHVTINPANQADRARCDELMRLALDMGSDINMKHHLTPANDHQLPVLFEQGGDGYVLGTMQVYCTTPGHSVNLNDVRATLPPGVQTTVGAYGIYCPVLATVQELVDFFRSNRSHMGFACRLADGSVINNAFALLKSDHDWRDLSEGEKQSFNNPRPGVRSPGMNCTVVRRTPTNEPEVVLFVAFEHVAFNNF